MATQQQFKSWIYGVLGATKHVKCPVFCCRFHLCPAKFRRASGLQLSIADFSQMKIQGAQCVNFDEVSANQNLIKRRGLQSPSCGSMEGSKRFWWQHSIPRRSGRQAVLHSLENKFPSFFQPPFPPDWGIAEAPYHQKAAAFLISLVTPTGCSEFYCGIFFKFF